MGNALDINLIYGDKVDSSEPPPIDITPLVVTAVLLSLAYFTIALRVYTRAFIIHAFGWDDITMILALASYSVYAGANLYMNATRTNIDRMPWHLLLNTVKCLIMILTFYVVTITLIKISLGIFLSRIVVHKSHRIIIWVAVTISTLVGIGAALTAVFQCGYPKSAKYYIIQRVAGQCISNDTALGVAYTQGVVAALTDFTFTMLPLFILKDAQMDKRAKITLAAVLCIAGFGSIASLVRFKYIKHLGHVTNDFFIRTTNLDTWSTVECGLGIIAGSAATLRPLYRKFVAKVRTHVSTSSYMWDKKSGSGNMFASGGSRGMQLSSRVSNRPPPDYMGGIVETTSGYGKGDIEWAEHSRAESMSEKIYDGNGPKIGTETVISVGYLPTAAKRKEGRERERGYSNEHSRRGLHSSASASSRAGSAGGSTLVGANDWPLGVGRIERETVFETVSERCTPYDERDGGSSSDDLGFGDYHQQHYHSHSNTPQQPQRSHSGNSKSPSDYHAKSTMSWG